MSNEEGNGTKKVGSGEYKAAGPGQSTIPAPPDAEENVAYQLNELKAVAERMGETAAELRVMCDRFTLQISKVKLAQLTSEHRANIDRAKRIALARVSIAHERELRDVAARLEKLEGPGLYNGPDPAGGE